MAWLGLLLGLLLLLGALRFDQRHKMRRREMMKVWEISEEVGQDVDLCILCVYVYMLTHTCIYTKNTS